MKIWAFIVILSFAGTSCRQRAVKTEPVKTVLEEKKIDVSDVSISRSGDLVDALYDELVRGSTELTELELQIKSMQQAIPDSLKDYKTFHEKNNAYYDFANKKIQGMSDSLLRKKMLQLIGRSRRQYTDSIGQLRALDSLINRRTAKLDDLHTILKLVTTLPLIEDFQKTNRPPSAPVEGALGNLDSLIRNVDSLVKY